MNMREPTDWKAFLSEEGKAQVDDAIASVDDAIASKIEEVLSRSVKFWKAPEVWQKSALDKLVRLFQWRDGDGYQVPANRVFLLSTDAGLVVSLHYFVYLYLAKKAGVQLIAFEVLEDGKGERLRLVGPDGIEREFCQLYEHFEFLKEIEHSWQAYFPFMFKITMFKRALAFFFPSLIWNNTFAEIVHFDEIAHFEEIAPF